MLSYKDLLEGAKIIRTADPNVVKRIKADRKKRPQHSGEPTSRRPVAGKNPATLFDYKGRRFIDTKHAAQRMMQRNGLSKSEVYAFFKRIMDKYLSLGKRYTDPKRKDRNEYLFFSKSLNQAVIVSYQLDRVMPDDRTLHFVLVTFLPRGRKNPKPGTEVILVESYVWEGFGPVFSTQFSEYMSQLRQQYGHKYPCFENNEYQPEGIRLPDIEFDMIFCDGKLFSLDCFEVIEVD